MSIIGGSRSSVLRLNTILSMTVLIPDTTQLFGFQSQTEFQGQPRMLALQTRIVIFRGENLSTAYFAGNRRII